MPVRLLIALFVGSSLVAEAAERRPNVLFIAIDDLNSWVGHLGGHPQARTPHIDRLAARGVSFTRAYCVVPACEPSRAALMSGKRPWTSGCYRNGDRWQERLVEGEQLSVPFLRAGYRVAGAGKIFHRDDHWPSEWSEYMARGELSEHGEGVHKMEGFHRPVKHDLADEDQMDWHTVDWCIERIEEGGERPFFIACGLHKPHLPFVVPKKYYERLSLDQVELPPHREDDLDDVPPAGVAMARPEGDHAKFLESGRWAAAVRAYLATCTWTDMNVGRLLDALDRSGRAEDTIVVLWGDHGWSFGEKKNWRKFALWEEPTRTPLVWVAPGVTEPGGRCDTPVDLLAIYPTLCDLAGLEEPEHLESVSLRPLLEDPGAGWERPAITTHGEGNHAVRLGPWRYIRYADGSEELYDHREDPNEWTNLATREEFAERRASLAAHLPDDE